MFNNFAHPRFNQIEDLDRKSADCASHAGVVGDDVECATRVDLGDGQDGGIDRFAISADDGLQVLGDSYSDHHRINAQMGKRRVRAFASDMNLELIGRSHHGPGGHAKSARGGTWPVMQAKDGVAREPLEEPFLNHAPSAPTALFGWLKNQMNGAVKLLALHEHFGGRQQHGRVAIVAASVHAAVVDRAMPERIDFLERQGVHVGSQADRAGRIADLEAGDDSCAGQTTVDRVAPFAQLGGDHVGGTNLLKLELRVGV